VEVLGHGRLFWMKVRDIPIVRTSDIKHRSVHP
jgi:hypothetical protein